MSLLRFFRYLCLRLADHKKKGLKYDLQKTGINRISYYVMLCHYFELIILLQLLCTGPSERCHVINISGIMQRLSYT